jgi:ubiquinone/menaquinone biosynthesis C-methylase UbiE
MKREKTSSNKGRKGAEEHRFSAEGDFVERLEGSERREIIPVESVLPRLGLGRDDVVADLGAGIGYFTFPVAREVREVIAIDMELKMLRVLSERIHKQRIPNVRLLLGEITDLPIADGLIDQVLAAFVYHEVSNHERLLRECARILRPGGHLTVVDFQKRRTSFGPPLRERKSPGHVLRAARSLFRLAARADTEVYYQLNLVKR